MCCERLTDWMRGYERSVKLRVEVRGKFGRPPKSLGNLGGNMMMRNCEWGETKIDRIFLLGGKVEKFQGIGYSLNLRFEI